MDRGELVSDDLIIDIVKERLQRSDTARGFVLDGFPRTVPQANALDEMLVGRGPVIVVEIQVPDEELVRRVVTRRVCRSAAGRCRRSAATVRPWTACPSCGGALTLAERRSRIGGARSVEGVLAGNAADDCVLSRASDLSRRQWRAVAGSRARCVERGGELGPGYTGGRSTGRRTGRVRSRTRDRVPLGVGDRAARSSQRAGGARAGAS